MRRRNFLGAVLGLSTLPAWFSCAFQRDDVGFSSPDESANNSVARAFLKAQSVGKPLLVIVIPQDAEKKYQRGRAWGELLNYGDLWPLSLCEVICASASEISALTPVNGEPSFYLLDGAEHIKATAFDTKLSFSAEYGSDAEEKEIDARIESLNSLVKSALAKDKKMLLARAKLVEDALGEEAARFKSRDGKTPIAQVDRFAALVAAEAPLQTEALTLAAEERLKNNKIDGSRWTRASSCGQDRYEDETQEEREERGMVKCGMGFTPEKSRRFLTFYLDESI